MAYPRLAVSTADGTIRFNGMIVGHLGQSGEQGPEAIRELSEVLATVRMVGEVFDDLLSGMGTLASFYDDLTWDEVLAMAVDEIRIARNAGAVE